MENQQGYRKLIVYQKADELAFQVYLTTTNFPKTEIFGLTSQMRRCAVSVPANIVEGYGRSTKKESLRFCHISRGSLTELEYYLDFALRLQHVDQKDFEKLFTLRNEVGRLLNGYINSLAK